MKTKEKILMFLICLFSAMSMWGIYIKCEGFAASCVLLIIITLITIFIVITDD